jgi:hypothetical protein
MESSIVPCGHHICALCLISIVKGQPGNAEAAHRIRREQQDRPGFACVQCGWLIMSLAEMPLAFKGIVGMARTILVEEDVHTPVSEVTDIKRIISEAYEKGAKLESWIIKNASGANARARQLFSPQVEQGQLHWTQLGTQQQRADRLELRRANTATLFNESTEQEC